MAVRAWEEEKRSSASSRSHGHNQSRVTNDRLERKQSGLPFWLVTSLGLSRVGPSGPQAGVVASELRILTGGAMACHPGGRSLSCPVTFR